MSTKWLTRLNADPTGWLLETNDPGPRYLTLRDVLGLDPEDAETRAAAVQAHEQGPIVELLDAMHPEGFWAKPGHGYLPKYRSTVWSLITLAQLGAHSDYDERIARACDYALEHSLADGGRFSSTGAPSGTVDCLQGNMCAALLSLGVEYDRLVEAYEWMARTVTGEGLAPNSERQASLRFYAGKCGPNFACGANNKLPCAWGATKVMLAFGSLDEKQKTDLIENAVQFGIDFLLGVDPATADYPNGWNDKPSGNWWKFGFPIFYVTDVLQILEALVALGYAGDPRLANAVDLVLDKQDERGRWPLEYSYKGKTWADFGEKKAPNKWVTIRALRVLKKVLEGKAPPHRV
ncbi:MAG: hypothetical protein PVH60_05065 [Anaerolineales bacterium]|jgi:hypothetical protein